MLIFLVLSQLLAANPTSLLQGSWLQPCENRAQREEVFSENQVTLTELFYYDKECTAALLTFKNHGVFQATASEIDFRFDEVTLSVHHPDIVKDFNDRKVCSKTSWRADVPEVITGQHCELFGSGSGLQVPPAGQERFGIYEIRGLRLYFGRLTPDFDASTPEKRPRELDARYFERIQDN